MDEPQGLEEWAAANVPDVMRNDPIWRLPAYRYALFLCDQLHADVRALSDDVRASAWVDQLLDSAGSISANIAEGYSRTSGPERAKFFEYAESSARECREWLFKLRHSVDPAVASERIALATRIMRILTAAIPQERAMRTTRARRSRPARNPARPGRRSSDPPP